MPGMFATAQLARRVDLVEAALVRGTVERVQARRPQAGAFALAVDGGWALFGGVGNPVNKVIGIGFDAPPDASSFSAIERAFTAKGAEVRAEVSTLARAETHAWLSRRGYLLEGFENVLGRSLQPSDATLPGHDGPGVATGVASGISVELVGDADVDAWMSAVTAGFASPDESGAGGDQPLPATDELAAIMDDVFRAGGMTRYLARIDGAVAGGASMKLDSGVALLAGAATLPPFRRRGAQRALLQARLADAARAGCDLAVVVTQPGSTSQANVQRQGFSLLYSRAVLVRTAPRV